MSSFFVHTIHTSSIRRYGKLDSTGDITLLKRWWNPFPVTWFNVDPFFADVKKILGNDDNSEVENEAYRILTYNIIIMLDRMLSTMKVLMQDHNQRQLFGSIFKRVIKSNNNLRFYQKKVEEITGIKIKDGNDLKRLSLEIQRRIDKFNERYPQDEKPKEKVQVMSIFLGVFSVMEMAFVPEMKLSEFGELRKLASERIKRIEAMKVKK